MSTLDYFLKANLYGLLFVSCHSLHHPDSVCFGEINGDQTGRVENTKQGERFEGINREDAESIAVVTIHLKSNKSR